MNNNDNDNITQLLLHDQCIQRFFTNLIREKLPSGIYRTQDFEKLEHVWVH